MTSLRPDGVHILAADGTVLRANLKDQKVGRARARDLSRSGRPVMLFDPRCDYRRLYIGGRQDEDDSHGVAAMRSGAFQPDDRVVTERVAPSRTHDDRGVRSQQTSSSRRARDGEQMDWTALVEALGERELAVPAGAFDTSSPDAKRPGIYAWWADEEACRLIGQALGADPDPERPIYIGKAEKTLASRVRAHLRVKIRSSTLRKSLTAILMTDQALAARYPDPDASEWLDELSDWMRKHLAVAIFPVEARQLRQAEQAALDCYDPPLNQQDAPTSSAELKRLRKLVDQRRK